MPIAEANHITPRSAVRYRPIEATTTEQPDITFPRASRTLERTRDISVQTRRITRTPHTSRTPHTTAQLKVGADRQTGRTQSPQRLETERRTMHWLVPMGTGMLVLSLLLLLGQFALNWGRTIYDDVRYGQPRTTQIDAFVGQESGKTPSHFIAMNYHGQVEIIEFPGGDARHARVFMGPQLGGENASQYPVLIHFQKLTGDTLPAMIVQCGNLEMVYKNEHGTFVAP